ncbi:hypothetical protein PV328_010045 [Microctonus aethiopoides]|uniref:Peptidase S1 domain-containing protein n=1 Tax=Microctonus aethiopoides TaxID=144406 RepID=A0AA39EXA5_9HYME|nr:hypothetical protein PV328_010045 [Microctonus aethiopoides]
MKFKQTTSIYIHLILNFKCLTIVFSQLDERQFYVIDDQCKIDKDVYGTCKRIQDCPTILNEALQGKRSANSPRCGFEKYTEIVCCPLSVNEKLGIRPAETACHQYENEIFTSLELELLNFHVLSGIEASLGEFPYMAALGYRTKDDVNEIRIKYDCGGTIISSRFILTAAHCVSNINEHVPILVRLGSVRLDDEGDNVQEILINNIIPHPKYKRSQVYNDIALIKLSKSIKWTTTVKPICLQTKALESIDINVNVSLIVAGWGATDIDQDSSMHLMKSPSLKLVPRKDCGESYTGFRQLPRGLDDKVLCAIDADISRHADTCQGDSGGPFIMRMLTEDIIIGITSFGQSCGGPTPGVYTSVNAFLDWIESHVWQESEN